MMETRKVTLLYWCYKRGSRKTHYVKRASLDTKIARPSILKTLSRIFRQNHLIKHLNLSCNFITKNAYLLSVFCVVAIEPKNGG